MVMLAYKGGGKKSFIGIDLFVAELPPLDAWLCIGVINSIKGNIIEWGWTVSLVMSQKRTFKVYS